MLLRVHETQFLAPKYSLIHGFSRLQHSPNAWFAWRGEGRAARGGHPREVQVRNGREEVRDRHRQRDAGHALQLLEQRAPPAQERDLEKHGERVKYTI